MFTGGLKVNFLIFTKFNWPIFLCLQSSAFKYSIGEKIDSVWFNKQCFCVMINSLTMLNINEKLLKVWKWKTFENERCAEKMFLNSIVYKCFHTSGKWMEMALQEICIPVEGNLAFLFKNEKMTGIFSQPLHKFANYLTGFFIHSHQTISWWVLVATATNFSSLTLAWPRSIVTIDHVPTFPTEKTRTWQGPPVTRPSMPILVLSRGKATIAWACLLSIVLSHGVNLLREVLFFLVSQFQN